MEKLLLHPTSTAQWHALIEEAQLATHHRLDEELESYLIFLLIRFTDKPQFAQSVMALEYLQSVLASGNMRNEKLRNVGDQCLLFSGLFPHQAEKRHVEINYFVQLGRGAYRELSSYTRNSLASMYAHLSEGFVALMDVLHSMRDLGNHPGLTPLAAYDLWKNTGSPYALRTLNKHTKAIPFTTHLPASTCFKN